MIRAILEPVIGAMMVGIAIINVESFGAVFMALIGLAIIARWFFR